MAEFVPYFADVGLGCDIVAYTEAELQRMRAEGSGLLRAAEAEGIVLAGPVPGPARSSTRRAERADDG